MKTRINTSATSLKTVSFWLAGPVSAWLMLAWLAFGGEAARAATNYEPYTFTNFAGLAGYSGSEDGIGSAARFENPRGVAVDSSGNVYVADTSNYTIRKITPSGEATTLAGCAWCARGTNDGMGSNALFYRPQGLAVDSSGNVYVADTGNFTIRKITPSGEVTTLAGLGGSFGSVDGTGSDARFGEPRGGAIDSSGNFYVADTSNHTIRKITPSGEVTTLAGLAGFPGGDDGTGSDARFRNPRGVAVDSLGNFYVADTLNYTIRKITPSGVVTTLAGSAGHIGSDDGVGSAARFNAPFGVAVDSSGHVYATDYVNSTIRKITPSGKVTTLAGLAGSIGSTNGTGSAARFFEPYGVAVDPSGSVYVADSSNHAIRKGWVVLPPVLTIAPDRRGGFFVRLQGTANLSYQLHRAQTLNGQWTTNAVQTAPGSGLVEFHDPSPPSDRGFYRAFQE